MATRPRGLLAIIADAADEAAGLVEAVGGDAAKPLVQRLRDKAKRARRAREHLGALQDRVSEGGAAAKKLRDDLNDVRAPRVPLRDVSVRQSQKEAK